jgi:hypothetical protein
MPLLTAYGTCDVLAFIHQLQLVVAAPDLVMSLVGFHFPQRINMPYRVFSQWQYALAQPL